jgi:hypothetical protein
MPKHPRQDPADEKEDSFSEVPSDDDQEPDVFAALTGQKKRRISGFEEQIPGEREDEEEDLQHVIRQATAKRDVKEGTRVVKQQDQGACTKGSRVPASQAMSEGYHICE